MSDSEIGSQASSQSGDDEDEDNIIKILIASDTHLGYMDKDPIRGNDSIRTFEEMLCLANEHEVDMILLGGDVFHDNKPSRRVLFKTMQLLREYCLGDRECYLEVISDQSVNFPKINKVNVEEPNVNISIPVFSIHGNHDDPGGDGNLCALELLSVNNLVNYFGNADDISDIVISPVLIEKGKTKLSLYGLGNIRDERLNRTFMNHKVKMLRPSDDTEAWFNLFVLHQNRVMRGPHNYIPETALAEFINLVIWGHEHDCQIDPVQKESKGFFISQPGSTVATSLIEGESLEKHVSILRIKGKDFQMEKIPLKSVRQLLTDEITITDPKHDLELHNVEQVRKFLVEKVESMVEDARHQRETEKQEQNNDKRPELPLIRLKVYYGDGFTPFNIQRFGQTFTETVANPNDILLFARRKKTHDPAEAKANKENMKKLKEIILNTGAAMAGNETVKVEDILKGTFQEMGLEMKVLNEQNLISALSEFVDKGDSDAIKKLAQWELKRAQDITTSGTDVTDEGALIQLEASVNEVRSREQIEVAPSRGQTTGTRGAGRGSGRGTGRATRGKRGGGTATKARGGSSTRGRASAAASSKRTQESISLLSSEEDISDDLDNDEYAPPKRKSSRSSVSKPAKQAKITASFDLDDDDDIEDEDENIFNKPKGKQARKLPFSQFSFARTRTKK